MRGEAREDARRWRAIALVAIGIAIGTTMTATPVYSHVGTTISHLWDTHIKRRTDARYFTKARSDARYYRVRSKVADSVHADEATRATSANVADQATNADNLGGRPASDYVRKCADGSVRGFVHVEAARSFPATWTATGLPARWNCADPLNVLVRRYGEGGYAVYFPGNPSTLAVGTVVTFSSDNYVTAKRYFDVVLNASIFVIDVRNVRGGYDDVPFTLLVY